MFFIYCFLSQKRAESLELLPRIKIFGFKDDVIIWRLDLALVLLLIVLHILDIGGEKRAVFDLSFLNFGIGDARTVDGDLSSCGFQHPGIAHASLREEEQQHAAHNQNGRKNRRRENPQMANPDPKGKYRRNDNHPNTEGQV